MALTIEGIRVNTSIEALAQGEGFIVRLNTSWNLPNDMRNVRMQAEEQDIIGQRLNGHEPTYADAKTALTTAMDQFETDVTTFISDWNSQ